MATKHGMIWAELIRLLGLSCPFISSNMTEHQNQNLCSCVVNMFVKNNFLVIHSRTTALNGSKAEFL